MKIVKLINTIIIFLIIFVSSSTADVPNVINYQGRLTDDAGDPVADDNYAIVFSLYNDSLAGDQFWTESHTSVKVIGGLFSILLGSTSSIPSSIIDTSDVFLEIMVGTETIQPRTRFVSVPYALAAYKAVSLNYENFVDEAGDTLKGDLNFYGLTGSGGGIEVGNEHANLALADNGDVKTQFWGETYGEMGMYDVNGVESINLIASNLYGGYLRLYDTTGTSRIELYGGPAVNSNSLVKLPSGSIDDDELMNEPGIASNAIGSAVTISGTVFTDIQTVTIVIPEPGYIYLSGTCYIKIYNDTSRVSGAFIQIDETEGGTSASSEGVRYSFPSNDYSATWRNSVSVDRVYYKATAGAYEFRLEAKKYFPVTSGTEAYNGRLTAMYFPTSYESVKTIVSHPGDNIDAIPVSVLDEDGIPTGETEYQVDLRYYELKAKQARIEALEAEKELRMARDRATKR